MRVIRRGYKSIFKSIDWKDDEIEFKYEYS